MSLFTKILRLSALHVTPQTYEQLKEPVNMDLLVFPKGEYGFFIAINLEDTQIHTIPYDLFVLLQYAALHECYYLELDIDDVPEDDGKFIIYPRF